MPVAVDHERLHGVVRHPTVATYKSFLALARSFGPISPSESSTTERMLDRRYARTAAPDGVAELVEQFYT